MIKVNKKGVLVIQHSQYIPGFDEIPDDFTISEAFIKARMSDLENMSNSVISEGRALKEGSITRTEFLNLIAFIPSVISTEMSAFKTDVEPNIPEDDEDACVMAMEYVESMNVNMLRVLSALYEHNITKDSIELTLIKGDYSSELTNNPELDDLDELDESDVDDLDVLDGDLDDADLYDDPDDDPYDMRDDIDLNDESDADINKSLSSK